jgi:hypothetical protein
MLGAGNFSVSIEQPRLMALWGAAGPVTDLGEGIELVFRTFDSDAAAAADGDRQIGENCRFDYPVLRRTGGGKSRGVIILLHGLNERSWDKYLAWALKMVRETGKTVICFPLAFHINRTPVAWLDRTGQLDLCRHRKELTPGLEESTFVNALLSERLDENPERFLSSGIQTYQDMILLHDQIRGGLFNDIHDGADIDFLTYSIGSTLGQVLLMDSPGGRFDRSRLFVFCGGAVIRKTNPLSKAILDNKAVQSLLSFLGKATTPLWQNRDNTISGVRWFRTLLDEGTLRTERETRLAELGGRLCAVALAGDKVIPADAVVLTNPGRTEILDFPYPYKHEAPFPSFKRDFELVDEAFNQVFDRAVNHLG